MTRRSAGVRSALRRLRIRIVPVPGQSIGLAALTTVLAAALVSAPLMTGSSEEGAWERERTRYAESTLGATLHSATVPELELPEPGRMARAGDLDRAVAEAVTAVGLPEPVFQTRLRTTFTTPTRDGIMRIQMLSRTGVEHQVDIIAGEASTDGVLIPARLAEATGLAPGDEITSQSEVGLPATLPVSGIFADPTAPLPEFWVDQRALFLAAFDPDRAAMADPPPAVLAPRELALDTATAVEEHLFLQWYIPLEPGIGIDAARATAERYDRLHLEISDLRSPVARVAVAEDFPRPLPNSSLRDLLASVDATVALLDRPVRAVGIGGTAAALILVGAWAGQRVRRREDELRSLVARGVSPARLAAQSAGEALLPVALGAAGGAGLAWLLVRTLGPSDRLPADALPAALLALAVGTVAAIVVVATVTAVVAARIDQVLPGRAAVRLARFPWLAVTTAVTVVTVVPLLGRDDVGRQLDLLTLGVPLLVTAIAAGALTALLPRIGPRTDARLRRLSPARFLAVRRVLATRGASRLVVVGTALALGLTVYAGALGDSSDRTVAAKGAVATPSDVVVPLVRRTVEDGPLPAGSTIVGTEQGATLEPGTLGADLLVVEPETFSGVVRWDAALADRPLDDLMGALTGYDGDRVPVLVAGPEGTPAIGVELTFTFFSYYAVPVEIVGRADAFPGQASHTPLLVADRDRFTAALVAADRDPARVLDRQVWATGEVEPVLQALTESGYAYNEDEVAVVAQFAARPDVRAQTWSLAYLRGMSLAAGLLALVGIAMHALAQQRRRTVAGVLLGRMGLSRRSSDGAAALEIGLLTGLAAVVAVAVAIPASALVLQLFDPIPTRLPDPLFAVPWRSLAAVLAGVVLVTVGSALLVGRAARRAVAGEVMREGA